MNADGSILLDAVCVWGSEYLVLDHRLLGEGHEGILTLFFVLLSVKLCMNRSSQPPDRGTSARVRMKKRRGQQRVRTRHITVDAG